MPIPNMIAVDGPAASGKSTIAMQIARDLSYLYFDTGVMYRVATLAALRKFESVQDERAVSDLALMIHIDVRPPTREDKRMYDVLLDGQDVTWEIRTPEVDKNVSQVSAYFGVRQALTAEQRRIGQRGKVVMVGRDIGTVVLPEAELKIYLEASVEERARRRYEEMLYRGEDSSYAEILSALKRRDMLDKTRAISPLRPAEDAVIVDTDGLSVDEVVKKVEALIHC